MKKYILVVIFGLHCAFGDGNYTGFLIALNFAVALVCAAFPFIKKNYIFFVTASAKFGFVFQRYRHSF